MWRCLKKPTLCFVWRTLKFIVFVGFHVVQPKLLALQKRSVSPPGDEPELRDSLCKLSKICIFLRCLSATLSLPNNNSKPLILAIEFILESALREPFKKNSIAGLNNTNSLIFNSLISTLEGDGFTLNFDRN